MEWSEGGECDNCNSIINKYIKKIKHRIKDILSLLECQTEISKGTNGF